MEKSTFSAVDFDVLLGCCVLCFPHSMTRQKEVDTCKVWFHAKYPRFDRGDLCHIRPLLYSFIPKKNQTKKRKEVKKEFNLLELMEEKFTTFTMMISSDAF